MKDRGHGKALRDEGDAHVGGKNLTGKEMNGKNREVLNRKNWTKYARKGDMT